MIYNNLYFISSIYNICRLPSLEQNIHNISKKNLAQRSNQNVKIARIIHDLNSKAARPLKWN